MMTYDPYEELWNNYSEFEKHNTYVVDDAEWLYYDRDYSLYDPFEWPETD